MKRTHVIFIAVVAVVILIFAIHHRSGTRLYVGKTANWHRYDAPDGNLSATLPSRPNVSTSSNGYSMTSVLSSYQSYIVTYTHLPGSVEGKADQGFAAVRRTYRQRGYTVLAAQDVQVEGHPGQDVHFEMGNGVYGWNRMFVIADGYYQLMYTTKQDRPAPVRFWNSLVLDQ